MIKITMQEHQRHPFHPTLMRDQLASFMTNISQLSQRIGLPLEQLQIDHIAMRINDVIEAEQAHYLWNSLGCVLSDAIINGRPIIVVKLFETLSLGAWRTDCVEIPYPIQGKTYPQEGWEHVECIVSSTAVDCDTYLTELKSQFPCFAQHWPTLNAQGISVKLSSPQGEGERLPNPTIAFKWQNICLKIHPHALEQVILSEQAQPIS